MRDPRVIRSSQARDENPQDPQSAPTMDPLHLLQSGAMTARHLRTIFHELSNLVDGSMRYISMAQRQLQSDRPTDAARRYLDSASRALADLASLTQDVTQSLNGVAIPDLTKLSAPESVGDAIRRAVEMIEGEASERNIRLACLVERPLEGAPAVPIFPVILNALRNSMQAIGSDGTIEVHAALHASGDDRGKSICIDIFDDGPGPPAHLGDSIFTHGVSGRSDGAGIGLALARDIISALKGEIELKRRLEQAPDGRRGAHLSIRIPYPNGQHS